MASVLGLGELWDGSSLMKLGFRLLLDLAVISLTIRWIYLKFQGRSDFAFSCVMLNVITFSICLLLRKVSVELGFALGLFGVFGILRYRTDPINSRDLTYLFVAIALGMLNAMANKKVSLAELLFINGTIVAVAAFLEYSPLTPRKQARQVIYDNLSLLQPHCRQELLADLRKRTGLAVVEVRVGMVDLLRDTAQLTAICMDSGKTNCIRAEAVGTEAVGTAVGVGLVAVGTAGGIGMAAVDATDSTEGSAEGKHG